jgi:HSP20 family protein
MVWNRHRSGEEAVIVTTPAKRERPALTDLFDWLESGFPGWPLRRVMTGVQPMRIEEFTEDGHYVVRAELPGVDPEKDVEVTVHNGLLTIKAERREEQREGQHTEFRYGTLTRTMTLPAEADENDVSATYADGILEVRVSLSATPTERTKRIPVTKR